MLCYGKSGAIMNYENRGFKAIIPIKLFIVQKDPRPSQESVLVNKLEMDIDYKEMQTVSLFPPALMSS